MTPLNAKSKDHLRMIELIKLEELALLILSVYLFLTLDYEWWIPAVLFFSPDLSILAYKLTNDRYASYVYNFFHHKTLVILLYIFGAIIDIQFLQLIGIIILAHASMDRMLGYGLKYASGFKDTHMGRIE